MKTCAKSTLKTNTHTTYLINTNTLTDANTKFQHTHPLHPPTHTHLQPPPRHTNHNNLHKGTRQKINEIP